MKIKTDWFKRLNLTRKKILAGVGIAAVAVLLAVFYNLWLSRTKIAFVNFQPIALQGIAQANDNSFIKLYSVGEDELGDLDDYDIVFVNGMGLHITAEQRQMIQDLASSGTPVFTTMATNPENSISNFSTDETALVQQYLMHGGRKNYRSLLSFLRRNIDGKIIFTGTLEEPLTKATDFLWYPTDGDEEELEFATVADYEKFLKEKGLYINGAKNIIVTGQLTDPSDLVKALVAEKRYNVYPVSSFTRLHTYAEQIHPEAIINLAHGRLGDDMVAYLKENNILLFDPLTINELTETWEQDPMGMVGGFMSQSVVMPEIDGAIRTSVLFAQEKDKNGLLRAYAIPERLKTFVATVNNYMALRTKANSEKRVAIVYFKGPGQAALVASGLDVVPSLYNLLLRMKQEGYNLNGLPQTEKEFAQEIQRRGSLFNSFAAGDAAQFMKEGNPQLVSKSDYDQWTSACLRKEKREEVDKVFGQFPGDHNMLRTDDGKLAFPRLQYGNVVLLPQPMAGEGKDEFKMVHGTEQVPPHSYIAPYLWAQYGFKADALIHFGTHGSLEFTPQKQVALSNLDWPDRLVGSLPHFYLYTIDNVGEGMTAKRRSYADLVSYLTPPFHESNLRGTYSELEKTLRDYSNNKGDKQKLAAQIKKLTASLGIDKDLGLDKKPQLTDDDITRIETYADELSQEKVTGTPYTLGVPYKADDIKTSVEAMTVDAIAYCRYNIDKQMGRAKCDMSKDKYKFNDQYIEPAKRLVAKLYNEGNASDALICQVAGITTEQLDSCRKITAERNAPKGMLAMMQAAAKKEREQGNASPQPSPKERGQKKAKSPSPLEREGERLQSVSVNPIAKFMRHQMRKMLATKDPTRMLEVAKKMGASPEALKKMEAAMKKEMNAPSNSPRGGERAASSANNSPAHGGEQAASSTTNSPARRGEQAASSTTNSHAHGGEQAASSTNNSLPHGGRLEGASLASAISQIETAINNVSNYRKCLAESPKTELNTMLRALSGGYIAPSPGGDPIANPNTLPTGRNLFAINAEATPTEDAWEKGVQLAKQTIADYRKRHNGEYPKKVSYTLWSGEFIQTGGATIAQVLYMLGVEPVRDRYGRVNDLQLIPSEELGRPRIDAVVQTSGQLRDLAASRLFLISKAVKMAAEAPTEKFDNMVKDGVEESERYLIDKGIAPKDARELSTYRVFGGLNGGYGSGIQGMVEQGDAWDDEKQVADMYINNMGGFYGDQEHWQRDVKDAFAAALTRTDVVVQPRQNNTWGALSLDHVYEFMGGMNLAVRSVTGKDPDAVFSDYRNRNNYRVQDSKEVIAVEARTKLLNESYVKEALQGGATATDGLAEMARNAYGWNVMKPKAVDKQLWDEMYNVYVKDKYNLGIHEQMGQTNPAAMQEMTATMMETARKGYWKATPEQLAEVAKVHTSFVKKYGPSGSSFEGNNTKLQSFIAQQSSPAEAKAYTQSLRRQSVAAPSSNGKAMVMEKTSTTAADDSSDGSASSKVGLIAVVAVLIVFIAMLIIVRKKRKNR